MKYYLKVLKIVPYIYISYYHKLKIFVGKFNTYVFLKWMVIHSFILSTNICWVLLRDRSHGITHKWILRSWEGWFIIYVPRIDSQKDRAELTIRKVRVMEAGASLGSGVMIVTAPGHRSVGCGGWKSGLQAFLFPPFRCGADKIISWNIPVNSSSLSLS